MKSPFTHLRYWSTFALPLLQITQPFAAADIVPTYVVTNANDSGTGSLRQALTVAAADPGPARITFDPSLSGGSITLTTNTSTAIEINDPAAVTIDASSLPGGLTLLTNRNASYRLFSITGVANLTVQSINLVSGGRDSGHLFVGFGGAIANSGTLALTNCTLSGFSSFYDGGAISNLGSLSVSNCVLSGNTASNNGGAIANDNGTLQANGSTLFGNTASGGGAIVNSGSLTLQRCTLTANYGQYGGGAIFSYGNGSLAGVHSTLVGNSCSAGNGGGLLHGSGNLSLEASIIAENAPNNVSGAFTGSHNITSGAPLLAPLGNYGGPTPTMALLPGSPARDTAVGSAVTSDQRGFPIIGTADVGAYEAGTSTNFNAFIFESLPATATGPQHAASFDFDGDGATNAQEWSALTNPADAASVFRISSFVRNGETIILSFPTLITRNYTLWQSDSLDSEWISSPGQSVLNGTGGVLHFLAPAPVAGVTKRFYRVQVSPQFK